MKTAKAYTETVTLTCPYCDECVGNPINGSHIWSIWEFINYEVVNCTECFKEIKVPKRISRGG